MAFSAFGQFTELKFQLFQEGGGDIGIFCLYLHAQCALYGISGGRGRYMHFCLYLTRIAVFMAFSAFGQISTPIALFLEFSAFGKISTRIAYIPKRIALFMAFQEGGGDIGIFCLYLTRIALFMAFSAFGKIYTRSLWHFRREGVI